MLHALTTQLVGSYTKPSWLVRHDHMFAYDGSWWRPDTNTLWAAKEDAVRLAIYDQERAGVDLLTDGEAQRQDFVSHFVTRFGGVDCTHLARVQRLTEVTTGVRRALKPDEAEKRMMLPRIVGRLEWSGAIAVDELRFLKRHTRKLVKATVVGPITAWQFMANEYYGDEESGIMAMATVLNQELRALDAEGADLLQIDEPAFHTRLSLARRHGVHAINRMVEGIRTPVAVHVCYGYAYSWEEKEPNPAYAECLALLAQCDIWGMSIEYEQPQHTPELLTNCGDKAVILGLLSLGTEEIEISVSIADRIRAAVDVIPPERLHPAPDCGMWHLPREVAYAKLRALVVGTEIIRHEQGL